MRPILTIYFSFVNLDLLSSYQESGLSIINIRNYKFETPLHITAKYGNNIEIAKLLVESGAIIGAKTYATNLTPAEYAKKENNAEMINFFENLNH